MSSTTSTILVGIISAIITTMVMSSWLSTPSGVGPKTETAFDRIMRTGTIRCGYYVFPPVTYRDPNTKQLSGFTVDFMNTLAERAGLKIEWTEEITFGNWVPALQARRFDMSCTPQWPELPMGKALLFTDSLFYAGIYPLRANDPRLAKIKTRNDLNTPDFTFIAQEGNMTYNLTQQNFPKAKLYSLPPNADGGEYYQAILTGKADILVSDRNGVYQFNKMNNNAFTTILMNDPVKLQSFPLVVSGGETDLLNFLNFAIREMDYSGDIDRILRKWEPEPGLTYLRRGKSFE
jgi:ABC-type amino acid transport substrate-binding protein